MSKLVFLAHLPLLRIDADEAPFAEGYLWRLPFETYDALSNGAFSDHRAAYEATAPVFFRCDAELELPILEPTENVVPGMWEAKFPSNNWEFLARFGLGFVVNFHDVLVDRVRAALVLAAPATSLPWPRLSATFVIPAEPAGFRLGDRLTGGVRVQGDADQEYLFLPELAGPPLASDAVAEAAKLVQLVDFIEPHPELAAALATLLGTTAPILSPAEQLTLSVVGLEALLLPEVKSGLGATFAQRVGALLGTDSTHATRLKTVAHTLYDGRSAVLHGGAPRSADAFATASSQAHGQQLLAAAIQGLAQRIEPGVSIGDLCARLDHAAPRAELSQPVLPFVDPPGLRREARLVRGHSPVVAAMSSGADMSAPPGVVLSWCPLIGLEAAEDLVLGDMPAPMLMPLSGEEMVSLEERDTARDFAGQLRTEAQPAAVLAIGAADTGDLPSPETISELSRQRDLAVVALRLAGFGAFIDPELLGVFVYKGKIRTRFPSVLRQTIEERMRRPAEEKISAPDGERVRPLWALLRDYQTMARDPEIDHWLTLFRRGFDRRFLPPMARAGVLLSLIEAVLGRFRPPHEHVQLETLVSAIAGVEKPWARWFSREGRKFRNSVAHGHWKSTSDLKPLEHLLEIARAIVPALLRAWLDLPDRTGTPPSQVLLNRAMHELAGNGSRQ